MGEIAPGCTFPSFHEVHTYIPTIASCEPYFLHPFFFVNHNVPHRQADNARVTPPSALHAAALALHCLLLGKGFVCTGQDDKAGAVKGFAAPVRDVPSEKVVPDKW